MLAIADDVSLYYETWGDAESPAVVLLHGFTVDLRMWAPHVEPLATDYRVVTVDLRGHGSSSAPDDEETYTMERYAEDVRALLDHLGIDVCALVGCSFGGMVALQFATMWPERVAALVVSDASPADDSESYDERFRERERGIDELADVVSKFGTAELGRREAAKIPDAFLAEGIRQRYASLSTAGFLGAFHARRTRPDLIPILRERLTMPTLFCAGETDPVRVAIELMADEVPAAGYVMFRGAGHAVPINRPRPWRDAVLQFFADVEDGRFEGGRRVV